MNEPAETNLDAAELRMPSFWLPYDAEGNGLPARHWAEIIVVSAGLAADLLAAFRTAGIAAQRAPDHARGHGHDVRVWVDASRYGHAENVLLHETVGRNRGDQ